MTILSMIRIKAVSFVVAFDNPGATPLLKQVAALFGSFLLAVILVSWPLAPAKAIFLRSGIGTSPSQITTEALSNETTSAIPANTVYQSAGIGFPDGEVTNGCTTGAPIYKLSDGTVVPFSETVKQICYPSGDLRFAGFMFRNPEAMAAATQYTVVSGSSYNQTTGVFVINTTVSPTIAGNYVVLNLTGTATAPFNQQWLVRNVSGTQVTLQAKGGASSSQQLTPPTVTGGTMTVPTYAPLTVYSGGTIPSSSNRSLSDFCQGTYPTCAVDINKQVTGLDSQLSSSTLTADLNYAINNGGMLYKWIDGDAGAGWKVEACYRISGSCQGQVYEDFYIDALQDQNGNLAGFREMGRTTAPYYNVQTYVGGAPNPNFWSFATIGLYNASTEIINPWSNQSAPINFTYSSSGCTSASASSNCFLASGLPWQPGFAVRLSNTGGSLPQTGSGITGSISGPTLTVTAISSGKIFNNTAISGCGIAAGTVITAGAAGGGSTTGTYTVSVSQSVSTCTTISDNLASGITYFVGSSGQPPYPTNYFYLCNVSSAAQCIQAITDCVGTCTAIAYPYITQFGSVLDAQSDGRMNFISCSGCSQSTDPTGQVISNVYDLSLAQLTPPWDFATAKSYPLIETGDTYGNPYAAFAMMEISPFYQSEETTGERQDIGPLPQWGAAYFMGQTLEDENTIRTIGLIGMQLALNVRDYSTKKVPCILGTSGACPSGMTGVSTTNFSWACGSPASGMTTPVSVNVLLAGFTECGTDHIPGFAIAAFIATAEPEYMDELEEQGAGATMSYAGQTYTATSNSTEQGINFSSNNTNSSTRGISVSSTTYQGTTLIRPNLMRAAAWGTRNLAAGLLASQLDPLCTQCYTYFHTEAENDENAIAAYETLTASGNSYAATNGFYNENQGNVTGWTTSYWINAWNLLAAWSQDAGAISAGSYMAKFPAWINNNYGTSYVGNFAAVVRQALTYTVSGTPSYDITTGHLTLPLTTSVVNPNDAFVVSGITGTGSATSLNGRWGYDSGLSSGSTLVVNAPSGLTLTLNAGGVASSMGSATQYVTNSGQAVGFWVIGFSYVANSPTLTVTLIANGYTLNNGDTQNFDGTDSCTGGGCPIPNFQAGVLYYVCDKSGTGGIGTHYELATDSGCTDIVTPTGSGTGAAYFYGSSLAPPFSTASYSYVTDAFGNFQMLNALGGIIDTTTQTDLKNMINNCVPTSQPCPQSSYPQLYQNNPTYWWGNHFGLFAPANDNLNIPANDNWGKVKFAWRRP